MKKSSKQLLLVFCLVIAVLLVGFAVWYFTVGRGAPRSSQNSPNPTTSAADASPLLTMAKRIIDEVGHDADELGTYGRGEDCNKQDGQYQCEVMRQPYRLATDGSSAPYGDFSYTASQMWARAQYYRATGDETELTKLKQDIDNFNDKVLNGTWILATSRSHCLFLDDIARLGILDDDYTSKLVRICNYDMHQIYPESIMNYDQHIHYALKYFDYHANESVTPPFEWGVTMDTQIVVPQDQIIPRYHSTTIAQINGYLRQLLDGHAPDAALPVGIGAPDMYSKFVRRNLLAALDFQAKINLSRDFEPYYTEEWRTAREIDYLLLTYELLAYYYNHPDIFPDTDTCLLQENLTYYFDHYAPEFTATDRKWLTDQMTYNVSDPTINYCRIVGQYFNNKVVDPDAIYQEIQAFNKQVSTDDWSAGYLYPTAYYPAEFPVLSTDTPYQYRFRYDLNAIAAGLLVQNRK